MLLTGNDIDRFWSKVQIRTADECWPWVAKARLPTGYGVLNVWVSEAKRRNVVSSRISCFLAHGAPPFAGAKTLHSCDNPGCCNPRHLRWGTQKNNVSDAIERKRHRNPPDVHANPEWAARMKAALPRGEANHNATLTAEAVSQIYAARLIGKSTNTIAQEIGIDRTTVQGIISGKAWKHLLGVNGNPTLAELKSVKWDKAPGAKITAEMASDIKARLAGGETGRSIALRYGIHFGSVSDIKRGLTWKGA